MTSYTGIPSDTKPYLQIQKSNGAGVPGTPIGIYPKLIARPKKMKFSKDLSVGAILSDIRRDTVEGIGSDTEVTVGGIRVFNHNDRFLFLGGAEGETAQLYERAGPIYQDTGLLPAPVGNRAVTAAFSKGGRWLFVVWSQSPNVVSVYRWSAPGAEDDGNWQEDTPIAAPAAVASLTISPLNTFLVVSTGAGSVVYLLSQTAETSALDVVPGSPNLALLDISADETRWLYRGNSNAEIHAFDGEDWTLITALAGTGIVESSRGLFSATGNEILFARSAATGSPITFARNAQGVWVQTYVESHASASNVRNLMFRKDGNTAALALTNAVEIYKRDVFVPDPIAEKAMPPLTGSIRGRTAASYDGSRIIATNNNNGSGTAAVYDDTADGLVQFGSNLPLPTGSVRDVALTADATVAFVAMSDNTIQPVKIGITSRNFAPAGIGTIGSIAVSPDNQHLSITTHAGGITTLRIFRFRVMDPTPATWTFVQVASVALAGDNLRANARAEFSPEGDIVIARGWGLLREQAFKFNGSSLTPLAQMALPAARGTYFNGPVWFPDGQHIVMAYRQTTGSQAHLFGIFRREEDSFVFERELPGLPTTDIAVSPDGKGFLGVGVSAAKAYALTETGWQEIPFPLGAVASPIGVSWSDRAILVTTGVANSKTYQWLGVNPVVAFKLAHSVPVAGGAVWAFNPDAALIHFGNDTVGHHLRLSDYAEIASLSFASGRAPSEVRNVLFSPTGKSVVFDTPDGLELATKPGAGGDFLNAKDITGTFVTIYDLSGDGKTFRERSYAVHVAGANVIDMSFSASGQIFSYHVYLPASAPADAVRGRLLYDAAKAPIQNHFALRGTVWDEEQTKTFIAYSPFETHAVLTNERLETGAHDVMLFEFDDNYLPVLRDTKPVDFGPPAFSYCDDVVVAHGGAVPFSFFKHDRVAEVLTPSPMDLKNWTYEGVIVDVEFRGNCEGLVVITPGTIIPIELDDDEAEAGEAIDIDIGIPDNEDDDTDVEIDDDVITIIPPMPGPSYPGDYEGGDGNPIVSINYVPYSVVTISYRVQPVPK